jgi:hypothetical protein
MSQTDAQAALAAAAQIMAATCRGPSITSKQDTLNMADGFMRWLRRPEHTTIERHADERLIPNEDFRSPAAARTERIDATAVLAAAHRADRIPRSPGADYRGVHVIAPEHCTTPSGKRTCQCGQAWPCSQSLAGWQP